MNSLIQFGTLELCDLPPGKKAIDSKWVFKQKYDASGTKTTKKARLTARGVRQRPGIDFVEKLLFTPVTPRPLVHYLKK